MAFRKKAPSEMLDWVLNTPLKFTGKHLGSKYASKIHGKTFPKDSIFNKSVVLEHPWVTAFYILLMLSKLLPTR